MAAFLNISPDHISPIEHPTFEDYFHCKRQIIANSRALVLGADCDHHDLPREDAKAAGIDVTEFAMEGDARSSHGSTQTTRKASSPPSATASVASRWSPWRWT